jgi:hypothetical protein
MCASCTNYEIRNTISPEVTIVGDKIGISYMLGPIKVNDTLKRVGRESVNYFIKNKGNVKLDLYVAYNDIQNTDAVFKYYISGILMSENRNVVKSEILLKYRDEIEGFMLIKLNGAPTRKVKKDGQLHLTPSVKLPEQKPIEDKGETKL